MKRTEYKLCWSYNLASTVTVPSSQSISLAITNSIGGNIPFEVQYDSLTKPSQVQLPAANFINVDSVATYDAAYPGGSVVTFGNGTLTRYLRAVVSDPFGASDITSLKFEILPPTGAPVWVTATQVASTASTKTFEYVWPAAQHVTGGTYQIKAAASEGTEGLRVSSATTTYEVRYDISGHVINDANRSLAERTTENGLANVTVQLFLDANQDGIPDSPGSPVQTVTTTGTGVYQGNYTFTNVPVGNYVIIETNPTGYTSTADTNPPNNDAIKVTLANANVVNQDFLDSQTAQVAPISGRVVNDADGDVDLAERAGELGIAGVTVTLHLDVNNDGLYTPAPTPSTLRPPPTAAATTASPPCLRATTSSSRPSQGATPPPATPADRTTTGFPSPAREPPPVPPTTSWIR